MISKLKYLPMRIPIWIRLHPNVIVLGTKVLRIFKELFQKLLKAEVRNGSSDIFLQIKKHGNAVLFVCIGCWGFRPKPGPKDFLQKVLWKLKNFAKIKWYVRCEVLWHTFLRKKGVFFCLPFFQER